MEWPQGAPDKSTAITTGDKIGMYKPTEAGTTNVKADVDDLKTFFQGDLATGITENADNITLNTANIGVNSGQIEANKDNIESNDADILALQNNVIDNDADILALENRSAALETKTPQSYKTTDSPTFGGVTVAGAIIPRTDPVYTTRTIAGGGGSYVLPRGLYMIFNNPSGVHGQYASGLLSGLWIDVAGSNESNSTMSFIISDGTNARLYNESANDLTAEYNKY